jgi:hypothetical protein
MSVRLLLFAACVCCCTCAGQVLEKRSPWRFSVIAELFMAAISLLVVL